MIFVKLLSRRGSSAGRRSRRVALAVLVCLSATRLVLPPEPFLLLFCAAGAIWVVWRRHSLGRRRWLVRYGPLWMLLFGLLGFIVATPYLPIGG